MILFTIYIDNSRGRSKKGDSTITTNTNNYKKSNFDFYCTCKLNYYPVFFLRNNRIADYLVDIIETGIIKINFAKYAEFFNKMCVL